MMSKVLAINPRLWYGVKPHNGIDGKDYLLDKEHWMTIRWDTEQLEKCSPETLNKIIAWVNKFKERQKYITTKPCKMIWLGSAYKTEYVTVRSITILQATEVGKYNHEYYKMRGDYNFRFIPIDNTIYWWEIPGENVKQVTEEFVREKLKIKGKIKHKGVVANKYYFVHAMTKDLAKYRDGD